MGTYCGNYTTLYKENLDFGITNIIPAVSDPLPVAAREQSKYLVGQVKVVNGGCEGRNIQGVRIIYPTKSETFTQDFVLPNVNFDYFPYILLEAVGDRFRYWEVDGQEVSRERYFIIGPNDYEDILTFYARFTNSSVGTRED